MFLVKVNAFFPCLFNFHLIKIVVAIVVVVVAFPGFIPVFVVADNNFSNRRRIGF